MAISLGTYGDVYRVYLGNGQMSQGVPLVKWNGSTLFSQRDESNIVALDFKNLSAQGRRQGLKIASKAQALGSNTLLLDDENTEHSIGVFDWAYGNGVFVFPSYDGVMVSRFGKKWRHVAVGSSSANVSCLKYGGGKFCAIAYSNNTRTSYVSEDGLEWEAGGSIGLSPNDIVWAGDRFIVCGTPIAGVGGLGLSSADGKNWTNIASMDTTGNAAASQWVWRRMSYGNGTVVLAGDTSTSMKMFSSDDKGVTLSSGQTMSVGSKYASGLIYNATIGKFVLQVAGYNKTHSSTTGKGSTWTASSQSFAESGTDPLMAFSNYGEYMFGLNYGNNVVYTTDGSSWSVADFGFVPSIIMARDENQN